MKLRSLSVLRGVVVVLASMAGVVGCSEDDSAAIVGDWQIRTVNGLVPSSLAQGCDLAGYDVIRLALYKPDSSEVVRNFSQSCYVGGFDTYPSTEVDFGTYDAEWQALDSTGEVIDRQRFPLVIRDFYTQIPGADFEPFHPLGDDISFSASWKLTTAGANLTERCAAAGVQDVAFAVYANDNTTDGTEVRRVPCTTGEQPDGSGKYISYAPELAFGRYLLQWRFLNAQGNQVGASPKKLWEAPVSGERIVSAGSVDFPPR